MKNYKVIINGTEYQVGVEEIDASEVKAAPAAAPKAAAPAPAGGTKVNSPMPGTILSVKVANGANCKKGDILMILEAMKMENEILAPCDGKVTVSVSQGATVDTGAVLCTIA